MPRGKRIPPEAFEFWVALGPTRTYEDVAAHFKVSRSAIEKHAARGKWRARLKRIEARAAEKRDEAIAETLEEVNERHLKSIRLVMGKAILTLGSKGIKDGYEAARALEAAIRQERLILGEPTARKEVQGELTTRQQLEADLRNLSRENQRKLREILEAEANRRSEA